MPTYTLLQQLVLLHNDIDFDSCQHHNNNKRKLRGIDMPKKLSYFINYPLFSSFLSLLLSFSPPLLSFLSFSSSPLFFNILLEAPPAPK